MKGYKITLIIGTALFWAITFQLYNNVFSDGYLQIPSLILTSIFFLLGLFCLVVLFRLDYFIKTDTENKENPASTKLKWKYFGSLITLFLTFTLTYFGVEQLVAPDNLTKDQVVEICQTVKEKPTYTDGPKAGSGDIHFKTNENFDIKFYLPFPDHFHYKTSLEKDFIKGDTICFSILKDKFNSFISKTEKLSFPDKHINHGIISIYTLRSTEKNYLSIQGYNKLTKNDDKWLYFLIPIVLLLGIGILQTIWKNEVYSYLDSKGQYKLKRILKKLNKK